MMATYTGRRSPSPYAERKIRSLAIRTAFEWARARCRLEYPDGRMVVYTPREVMAIMLHDDAQRNKMYGSNINPRLLRRM